MIVRIGNCAGFSGDRVDAPGPVVDTLVAAGGPAAVFFEVLGERTVALAQLERRRDPSRGYEPMLERLIAPILAKCAHADIPILGNFGAANPPAAAALIARLAEQAGLPDLRIAVIGGDDVRDTLDLDALDVHEGRRRHAGGGCGPPDRRQRLYRGPHPWPKPWPKARRSWSPGAWPTRRWRSPRSCTSMAGGRTSGT